MATDLQTLTHTSGKRSGSLLDPLYTVQKRQRRMDNIASEAPLTPMISLTPGSHATSPDSGIGHDDDVVPEPVQHGTVGPMLVEQSRGWPMHPRHSMPRHSRRWKS